MISIVMSTYNGERYLREQVESILLSTVKDIELLICDDGSKDGTMEMLKTYEEAYPQLIHIHKNEKNVGYTLNFLRGALRAKGDYIMFCDQDDVWKAEKVEKTLDKMKQLEKSSGKDAPLAIFTDALVVDEQLNPIHKSFFASSKLNPRKTDLAHILMENKLIGCTVMFNRALCNVLKEASLPSQARYHDWWVALIASTMGKIDFFPDTTLLYRQHGRNVVGNQSFTSYVKNRIANLDRQKEALAALQKQAQEFLSLYHDLIPTEQYRLIHRFAHLGQQSFIRKRFSLIRYGYLKSGLIRNLGLMIVI